MIYATSLQKLNLTTLPTDFGEGTFLRTYRFSCNIKNESITNRQKIELFVVAAQ